MLPARALTLGWDSRAQYRPMCHRESELAMQRRWRVLFACALCMVGCTMQVIHPRAQQRSIRVTWPSYANAKSPPATERICFYDVGPPVLDRRWVDQIHLPKSGVISIADGDVSLDLYDCATPPNLVWSARNVGTMKSLTISKERFALAEAERRMTNASEVPDSDSADELERAGSLLANIQTAKAHSLRARLLRSATEDESKVRAELSAAASLATGRLPAYLGSTDAEPSRALALTELADELRWERRSAAARDAYRDAKRAWDEMLAQADGKRAAIDLAHRWHVLQELVAYGDLDASVKADEDFKTIIAALDPNAANLVLLHLIGHHGDPDVARRMLLETPLANYSTGEYWRLYVAALYEGKNRPLPDDLLPEERIGAKLRAHLESGIPANDDGSVLLVQQAWFVMSTPDVSEPNDDAATQDDATNGLLNGKSVPQRDRYRWVPTLSLLRGGEAAWPRVTQAVVTTGALTEAHFYRGLLRWSRGQHQQAREDFLTVKNLGVAAYNEYLMARDALAALDKEIQ